MRYLALIYGNEAAATTMSKAEQEAEMVAYDAFGKAEAEHVQGGEALHPTSAATTVRVREGKTLTTDGPFAETKEQLGGFYMIQCKDLDEAIAVAAKIPGAKVGSVEIRPIVEWG
ncbi:MAG: YciI family protein [Ktedonobacteraceae bacterium]